MRWMRVEDRLRSDGKREWRWSKERVILCVLSPAVLCVLLSVARGGVSRTEVSTYRVHFACDLVSLSECRVEVWWRERSGVKGGKGVERIEWCLRRGDASERRDPAL